MKGFRNKRVLERRFPGRDDRGVVDTRPGERTHFEDGYNCPVEWLLQGGAKWNIREFVITGR